MKARNPISGNFEEVYVKALDSMPVGTQVEYTGSTIPVGWEEVNDYSTTETYTGKKWIDGKKIYRKVINDTKSNSATLASNVDTLISCNGTGKSSTNYRTLPYYEYYNNSSYTINVYQTGSDIKAQITMGSTTSTEIKVTLEYTKTTD